METIVTQVVLPIAGILATALVGVLAWSMRRNVQDIDKQVTTIATDVRTLAAQGARHGESLAAGVQQFKNIEKRLDKLEEWKDQTLRAEKP